MNTTLYYSSIFSGIIIVCISYGFISKPRVALLLGVTYMAIITSILNHGTTNTFYKFIDRCVMCLTTLVYIYYIIWIKSPFQQTIALSIVIGMILLYSYKLVRTTFCRDDENAVIHNRYEFFTAVHLTCHILSVVLFIIIIFAK